ncbi:MAG TPA: hypothetical protein VGC13_08640 [Longimicrobium sp.]|jgi:hypothetical protein
MDKLNPETLNVESFTPDETDAMIGMDQNCTGCDSTCGIVWP